MLDSSSRFWSEFADAVGPYVDEGIGEKPRRRTEESMEPTQLIFAKELAEITGQCERSARSMLAELERKHKAKAITRVGRERCTTWAALERYTALRRGGRDQPFDAPKLLSTLRRVLSENAGMVTRIGELESDLSDLRVRVATFGPRASVVIA
jgi:hypothetical protein